MLYVSPQNYELHLCRTEINFQFLHKTECDLDFITTKVHNIIIILFLTVIPFTLNPPSTTVNMKLICSQPKSFIL